MCKLFVIYMSFYKYKIINCPKMDFIERFEDNNEQSRLFQQYEHDRTQKLYYLNQQKRLQDQVNNKNTLFFIKFKKNKNKLQICYWLVVLLLIGLIIHFKNDNRSQEKDIQSLMNQIGKIKNKENKIDATSSVIIQQSQLFLKLKANDKLGTNKFPRLAWYFKSKNLDQSSLWTVKCFQNYKNKAIKSQLTLFTVDIQHYSHYIPKDRYQAIQQTIKGINFRYESGSQPEVIRYRDQIIRQLIILEVLIQNGGIYLEQDIILTEDFTWLNQIHANNYVNAKQWIKEAEFIGFHSPNISPQMEKYTEIETKIQTQKYVILTPSISPYFFATVKNSKFLNDLRFEYYNLLNSKQNIKQQVKGQNLSINIIQTNINLYKYLFQISSQIAIMKKNAQLASLNNQALHFYQLATINQKFGPYKLQTFFTQTQYKEKIFNHLALMTRQQLQYEFGKMRYMIKLDAKTQFQDLFIESIKSKNILTSSLLYQQLLQQEQRQNLQSQTIQQSSRKQTWDALPAKIWTYSKYLQSNLLSQIWRKYNKILGNQSKFQFIILNQKNLNQYISAQSIQRIRQAITSKDNKLRIHDKTKMEMISLAVLYEHGGVWIDPQIFLAENLEWLRNINQQPFVWNKSGSLPKVLLVFHPFYGPPFEWKYNKKGLKQAWHLGYQKSFMAAQPKAQLLKLWLDQYIQNLKFQFQLILNKFYECRITNGISIKQTNHQFLVLDTLKCVLGSKKMDLISQQSTLSPAEYYGLWAINGFTTYLKIGERTSFVQADGLYENSLFWRYSSNYTEGIMGKINYLTRINHLTNIKIQQLCKDKVENMSIQFNQQSFFMKMLSKMNETVIIKDNRLYLEKELKELEQAKRMKKNIL